VGDERAETYLRVLAESKFRDGPYGLLPVDSAGLILAAAGLLDDGFGAHLVADLRAALTVRSSTFGERYGGAGRLFEAAVTAERPPGRAWPGCSPRLRPASGGWT